MKLNLNYLSDKLRLLSLTEQKKPQILLVSEYFQLSFNWYGLYDILSYEQSISR